MNHSTSINQAAPHQTLIRDTLKRRRSSSSSNLPSSPSKPHPFKVEIQNQEQDQQSQLPPRQGKREPAEEVEQYDFSVETAPQIETDYFCEGRGRSPFWKPVTAAIDSLVRDTRHLENLVHQIARQQQKLKKFTTRQQDRLDYIRQDQVDAANNKMQRAPSLNKSRSQSLAPDKFIQELRKGIPPILPFPPDETKNKPPQSILAVMSKLKNLGKGCIPFQLKDKVLAAAPQTTSEYAIGNEQQRFPPENADKLWRKANKIHDQAYICEAYTCDEMAWSIHVVRRVLAWETSGSDYSYASPGFSRVEAIQTQAIASDCRTNASDGELLGAKKSDFALAFSIEHPDILQHYEHAKVKAKALSQMSDVYTSRLILHTTAEVKKFGGNETEAQGQLFTNLGGGVIRQRSLLSEAAGEDNAKPLLGWTIVGHSWKLYAAVGVGNTLVSPIHIFGPLPGCSCSTSNHEEIFKLLRIVAQVKTWAKEDYWPWFKEKVLEPMKK